MLEGEVLSGAASFSPAPYSGSRKRESNKRIKFAHYVRPTRTGEAPLLATYAQRWT